MKIQTNVKAGGMGYNHNASQLRVRTGVKAGDQQTCNHNEAQLHVRAGGTSYQHNEARVHSPRVKGSGVAGQILCNPNRLQLRIRTGVKGG